MEEDLFMTKPSLGITAMELFACNPFRVLGIAVDTPTADVTLTYKKLLDMAAKGETADYETPYDFDFLPPFSRSEKDLKTAYAKIASNGYRCFAFSDSVFSASLNIDDVMLNLRDISCYDCFLRCYMWLITNDRDFEEPELWIPLCQYIDKMIMSSPDQWEKYFDHRFPQDMLDSSMSALRSFYATFCDIILLPIKEMVRGSMKCRSAMEILKIAKVDVDEVFPDIDIPQANLPKNGEPAPLLKIAVKDGEEYYDVATGKMVNFEGDEDSAIESNDFSAAASSISADAIVGDEGPDSEPIPDEPEENPELKVVPPPTPIQPVAAPVPPIPKPEPAPQPAPVQEAQPAPTFMAQPSVQPSQTVQSGMSGDITAPIRKRKIFIPGHEGISNSAPVSQPVSAPVPPVSQPAPAPTPTPVQAAQPVLQPTVAPVFQQSAPQQAADTPKPAAKKPYKKANKGLTSLIDTVDEALNDTSDIILTDEADEEENLYTDTLIKMLRANRSNNQLMKSVDTKHIYDNGDSLGKAEEVELSMDAINMKKMDKSLLNSSYDNINPKETDPKKLREEKYRNININDMLNPTVGSQMHKEYKPDAIEEFVKAKKQEKSAIRGIWKLLGVLALLLIIYVVLLYTGLI